MAKQDEFNLIIESVDATNLALSAKRFAEAFGLDPELTQAMLSKTLPILFVTRLTKREVKAVLPKLEELSRDGFEFRITTKTPKIAKVNWLKRPNFSIAGGGPNSITFDWQDTAFVCPSCGDTFLFKRVGTGLPVSRVESTPATPANEGESETPTPAPAPAFAPVPAPAPAPAMTTSHPPTAARPPEPEPELPHAAAPAPAIDLQIKGDEEESPSLPPQFEAIEEPIPFDDLPPAKQSTDLEAPVVQQGPISAAFEEGTSAAIQPTGTVGESYNVFVPEVKDPQKREEVVKLISEIRDCSPDEARKLTRRIMIPVAKNVPREKAEKILSEFRRLRITGRMTKATRDE